MGSDRARISYDPGQQYRSVVMQQGRVTLEADWNEAQSIAGEQARLEALDFVGPAGTPDNGYAISLTPGSFDFNIGPGTMYVGGMRASLPQAEVYSQQSETEWLDSVQDPTWVPVAAAAAMGNEYIYLYLREQEVSSVEDSGLLDIALGGPDTAQRTRLVQHVVRLATSGTDCPSALSAAQTKSWADDGFTLNASDLRVSSFAQLQVGFVTSVTQPTPCDPTAQGGYLGADNQFLRVQISNATPGQLAFVWGYDDASFLYQVQVINSTTVKLQAAPVDAEHIPQSGQAVELLLSAVQLANGQYMAAPAGQVFPLSASTYDPDSKNLTLTTAPPSALDAIYQTGVGNATVPPVFLRVWQGQVAFTPGAVQPLAGTGLQVTITNSNAGQQFRVGDYWMFAVRPASAGTIYPPRYINTAQPPDGPREWICPLAVIGWNGGKGSILSDCRATFGPVASKAMHITGINWPNDDLLSLPAFRNNPLQVTFDSSPSGQSVTDSTMIVAVEIPYGQARTFNQYSNEKTAFSTSAEAGRKLRSEEKIFSQFPTPVRVGPSGVRQSGPIGDFGPASLPNDLLTQYQSVINAAAASSLPSTPAGTGYVAAIQAGDPTVASGTVSWNLLLPADDFIPYLSSVSQSEMGAQLRVRVTLKGREIWNGSKSPLVYLDGQAFGQPATRADGTTPRSDLTLPSGADARASDFESWFWLSLFVWGETAYSVGDLPLCAATGDFTGDGTPDMAVATRSGGIFILLNDGKGGFTAGASYQLNEWPLSIVAASFSAGGPVDLAVTSYTSGTVTILAGSGTGTFTQSPPIKVGEGPWAMVAASLSGDGPSNFLAVTNAQSKTVSILLYAGGESFPTAASSTIPAGTIPIGIVAADFNGDGSTDLAVLNAGDNTVSLLTGNGTVNFVPATSTPLALPADGEKSPGVPYPALPLSIAVADFTGDGLPDLAIGGIYQGADSTVSASYVAVFPNNPFGAGAGTFSTRYDTAVAGIPGALAVASYLDPTGPASHTDLVVTGASFLGGSSSFSILVGSGNGTFQPVLYPVEGGFNPTSVIVTDFNGDGIQDLALTTSGGNVSVLLNEQSQISSSRVFLNPLPPGLRHVGDSMTATGKSLSDGGTNSVFINFNGALTQVTQFTTQSDTTPVFTIPPVDVLAGGNSVFLLVVSPTQGSAAAEFTLLPEAITIPTGDIKVQLSAPPNTVFHSPGTYVLGYTISANTNLSDTYSLQPSITATSDTGDGGWGATIINTSGESLFDPTVVIPPAPSASQNTIVQGNLQLTIPEAATGSATLTLTVVSKLNPKGLTVASPAAVIPVGGSVLLSSGIGVMANPPAANLVGGNLLVPLTGLQLDFSITTTTAGTYDISYSFDNTDWSAAGPTAITVETANQPVPLSALITPQSGATPTNFYLMVALSTGSTIATKLFYPIIRQSFEVVARKPIGARP